MVSFVTSSFCVLHALVLVILQWDRYRFAECTSNVLALMLMFLCVL